MAVFISKLVPEYKFEEEPNPASGQIFVLGLSLQPQCSDRFSAWLEQLKTHQGEAVTIAFQSFNNSLNRGCTVVEARFDDSRFRGIIFPLDGNGAIRAGAQHRVRMGSLDLAFLAGEPQASATQGKNSRNSFGWSRVRTFFRSTSRPISPLPGYHRVDRMMCLSVRPCLMAVVGTLPVQTARLALTTALSNPAIRTLRFSLSNISDEEAHWLST